MQTFLVFTRSDRHEWAVEGSFEIDQSAAIAKVNRLVTRGEADRAVVMEVGGVDAMPTFTYRYGARA